MALARIPRYSAMGMSLISFETLPAGVRTEVVPLKAEDRGESKGVLYTKGGEKTVVCLMHPRADMSRHYAIPYLLNAGYAAFGQEGRWPNNDIACLHQTHHGFFTKKWPGKPTPTSGMPRRVPTSMYTTDKVMGIPSLRSSTSFRKLLRGSPKSLWLPARPSS